MDNRIDEVRRKLSDKLHWEVTMEDKWVDTILKKRDWEAYVWPWIRDTVKNAFEVLDVE